MRKNFNVYFIFTAFILLLLCALQSPAILASFSRKHLADPNSEVAIIVPAEHSAMESIVEGFKLQIAQEVKDCVHTKVYRAYGESALLQACMQQIALSKAKIVLPIGTNTTLMALQHLPNKPIVHLAAKLREEDKTQENSFTGVLDEIAPEKILAKAFEISYFKKIALIHSTSEKSYPEAAALSKEAKRLEVELLVFTAANCSEVFSLARHIPSDCDLILILKDHLIVSALPCLIDTARHLRIPLMASDEGSVTQGATMALAIKEEEIGHMGAKLCARVLAGETVDTVPIVESSSPTLFYNEDALEYVNNKALVTFVQKEGEVVGRSSNV